MISSFSAAIILWKCSSNVEDDSPFANITRLKDWYSTFFVLLHDKYCIWDSECQNEEKHKYYVSVCLEFHFLLLLETLFMVILVGDALTFLILLIICLLNLGQLLLGNKLKVCFILIDYLLSCLCINTLSTSYWVYYVWSTSILEFTLTKITALER